jgi:diguanylate cyclase (GGDEF)-like protein/PAS domain S-box-containing protein
LAIHDLSTLFDLLPIGAYRTSPDGQMVRLNAALLRLNGYDSEAQYLADGRVIGARSYVEPGRRQQFWALVEALGQVTDFTSEIYRLKTGERIWVREHAHVVRDEQGRTLYIEGTVEDITLEREATLSLQRSENLLRNVLETIPDRVWLKDQDGIHLACNTAYATRLGATVAQVIGTADTQWFGEDLAAVFGKTDRAAIQLGKTVNIEGPMPSPVHTDPTIYEVIKTPMRDANGQIVGVLGMARDIQARKTAETLLRDTTEQLELALMGADLGRWDHDLTIEKGYYLDARSCAMLGRDPAESNHGRAWGHLIHPDDLPGTLDAMRAHLVAGAPAYEAEYRARHSAGHWVWLSNRGKVVQFNQAGKPLRMVGTLMDVSKRKQVESELLATQAELQATLQALPDLVFEFNGEGRYRAIHSHGVQDLLHPENRQIDKLVSEVLPQESAGIFMAALEEALETGHSVGKHYSLELARGKQWFELSVVRKPTPAGEEERLIAIARNITERKLSEQAIAHLAFHDTLTGLPNRRMLGDRIETALAASQRSQTHGALLFLDLDKFKYLNDTHGHEVGDLVLQEVAQRLLQCIRAVDTVARLGGDEFVVLIQNLSADADDARMHAATVGHKILASLNEPYLLQGIAHSITPSIGATLFLGRGTAAPDLVKQADLAMYEAKAEGRNTLCFYARIGP